MNPVVMRKYAIIALAAVLAILLSAEARQQDDHTSKDKASLAAFLAKGHFTAAGAVQTGVLKASVGTITGCASYATVLVTAPGASQLLDTIEPPGPKYPADPILLAKTESGGKVRVYVQHALGKGTWQFLDMRCHRGKLPT